MPTLHYSLEVKNLPGGVLSSSITGAVQAALQTSMSVIMDKWRSEAQNKLDSTRLDYLIGLSSESMIYPYNGDFFSGAVRLQGKAANAVEQGYPAFDQKLGFSMSDKRVIKPNGGWYLTIPLRHGTPGSTGRVGTSPMPKDIYSQAKKLVGNQSLRVPGGQLTSWTGYVHKNNIFDGLRRIVKSYKKANQATYFTFRRVSDNSDPLSWMHPGYAGIHLAETIKPYAEQTFKYNMDRALKAVL